MDYKDVQIPGSVGCLVGGVQSFCGITTNAAKARLQGFEAEANAVLARDFAGAGSSVRFNGSVGFIDAKYKRFIGPTRSEEHTSELQSLMRISYAVFCLKKKNTR